ncbi:MAG: cyclase family protein [Firmicutes bacterium]|nr:cyclase family protein [Bacillota bacterium]MDD4263659.1 cyclase family protein [Bacillota bacterium]MDD4693992.1 cyclase family protein [Bacillota bacterium]
MWIDISISMSEAMPIYPGDPRFSAKPVKISEINSRVNLTEISLGTHTGTHIDAPKHVFSEKKTVTDLDLNVFIGPCYVLEISEFSKDVLKKLPKKAKRILLKANSDLPGKETWLEGYKGVPPKFAELLLNHLDEKPLLIGIDALSIEEKGHKVLETHGLFLSQEIIILEGINLSHINEGNYQLAALPLKLESLDGSPVRAALKRI